MSFAESHHCCVSVSRYNPGLRNMGDLQELKPRRAPKIKNMFVSAVESSTAVGTFETRIPFAVQACTSIWSYPAPTAH